MTDAERGGSADWWDEAFARPLGNNEDMVEGVVERVNPSGFTLGGRPGWLNFSKLTRGPRPALGAGDRVAVRVGGGKFVNAVRKLDRGHDGDRDHRGSDGEDVDSGGDPGGDEVGHRRR
jgi:hypothetical protein